ncbi:MAG TPA: radical SAM protein [Candidatus Pullichristensenella stercorigallinarum]|uniref:Radical SAM protein n=1 Tax=Candidatus Pullichristensenella stercorigallinarum TaxID=2840909 RepID=A0A9D0ZK51_9FIRM|nr:radical SAM protein [Candidatus Pullichristensenella stercorigallinarum]
MCNIMRSETGSGVCKMGAEAVVSRAAPHFDEEPVISGTRGSGAIFFAGCALRCRFCQNYGISHGGFGRRVSVEGLKHIYADLIAQGVHNINLVNPTHFVEPILASLSDGLPVPVVWNTGGYERVETIRRLEGRVRVFLPDLKYRFEDAAGRYSGARDYFTHASAAIREMLRQTGPVTLDRDGMIQSGVIVRHLILPGRVEESKAILRWIAGELPGAWVSLMAQYVPMGDVAGVDALERRLTQEEYDEVVDCLFALGLEDGFVQELSSAEEKYIPQFDLTGVPDEE